MNANEFFHRCLSDFRAENRNVLYFQVTQNGELCGEYKCAANKARLNVYSISKSFVSCAWGIAEAEGLVSMNEKICDSFQEYLPEHPSPFLMETTPHHLLTMNSGLKDPLFFSDGTERYREKNWLSYFFHAEFDHAPGTRFLYSNFPAYVLSCLIEKRAGCNLLEYLRSRLFEPLGIGNPDWTLCPAGHVHASFGLQLNIDELTRFGEMLLHYGEYHGQQLVPAEYLREAFTRQTESIDTFGSDALNHGYGFQFWKMPIDDITLCFGGYGQFCLVDHSRNLVCSILSFEGSSPTAMLDIMLKYLPEL